MPTGVDLDFFRTFATPYENVGCTISSQSRSGNCSVGRPFFFPACLFGQLKSWYHRDRGHLVACCDRQKHLITMQLLEQYEWNTFFQSHTYTRSNQEALI